VYLQNYPLVRGGSEAQGTTIGRASLSLLHGAPSDGGMDLQPWERNITARHAFWARRLALALAASPSPSTPPWVHAARAILKDHSHVHPALQLLPYHTSLTLHQQTLAPLTGPLAQMAAALLALGPPPVGAPPHPSSPPQQQAFGARTCQLGAIPAFN